MVCPVSTAVHIPRSVHLLLAKVLSIEFCNATFSLGLCGFFLLAKVVLRMPPFRLSILSSFCFSFYVLVGYTLYGGLCWMIFVLANQLLVLRINHAMFLKPCFGHVKDDIVMLFCHSLLQASLIRVMILLFRSCLNATQLLILLPVLFLS